MKRVSAWVSAHLPIVAILIFVTAGAVVSATGDKHLANGALVDSNGQSVTTPRDASGNALGPGPTSSPGSVPLVVPANPSASPYSSVLAGADTLSNTQTMPIHSTFLYAFNGTTWDRARTAGSGTGALLHGIVDGLNGNNAARTGTPSADAQGSNTGLITWSQIVAFNGTTWDRIRKDTYAAGPLWQSDGGSTATDIAANAASPQVIKGSAGRIARIMITVSAAAELDCYDNASAASGTLIGVIVSGAPVGTVANFQMKAANGITCGGGATYPGYTISFW